ncbi:hypothetical protein PIB30_083149 [Stylosanthes scabra]|uniref:Uncharacterized protein n=1 Tax=Stylosanthes scabra TaxID=79078 RepID=A0ABU6XU11_9FABA|nr:hypothetical protein [Stylosanthes scabra]
MSRMLRLSYLKAHVHRYLESLLQTLLRNWLNREKYSQGLDPEKYPNDLQRFPGKTHVFKVNASMSGVNYFQPCMITVSKITCDEELLRSYMIKYNVDLGSIATSTKSPTVVPGVGVQTLNSKGSPAKTPSPPVLKKIKFSKSVLIDVETPTPNKNKDEKSPNPNCTE